MAKKSMIAREVKRRRLAELHDKQRLQLKQQMIDEDSAYDERWQAMVDLQKLPRDSSKSRQRNRCALTGRPRLSPRPLFRRTHLHRGAAQ